MFNCLPKLFTPLPGNLPQVFPPWFPKIGMTSFLSEVYFFHKRGVQFSLLFCIHCSFSHFCFDVPVHPGDVEMVTFGMHSSFP